MHGNWTNDAMENRWIVQDYDIEVVVTLAINVLESNCERVRGADVGERHRVQADQGCSAIVNSKAWERRNSCGNCVPFSIGTCYVNLSMLSIVHLNI